MSNIKGKLVLVSAGVVGLASTAIILGQSRRINKLESELELAKTSKEIESNKRSSTDVYNSELLKINEELESSILSLKEQVTSKTERIAILNREIEKLSKELLVKPKTEIKIKEIIKEVPVEVVKEVIKEVPVEIVNEVVKEVPVEIVKEVQDKKTLDRLQELEAENSALNIRCTGQTEKLKELKGQLRESKRELEEITAELKEFKAQMKLVIDTRNEDKEAIKQVTRTVDRVGKKVNKKGGK